MSGRMVDQPPSDVHTLATQALELLDERLPMLDKVENLPTVRSLLKRIQAVVAGVREAQEDDS